MGKTLNFKVSAGLKSILGQDLITDDYVAVLELVKNSYDAGAKKVVIKFEPDSIVIADDGMGMTMNDITDKWLFLAYSAKKVLAESSYRDHLRRHYAGAKGIGRMSCDRLGQALIMETCHEGGKLERLDIDLRRLVCLIRHWKENQYFLMTLSLAQDYIFPSFESAGRKMTN